MMNGVLSFFILLFFYPELAEFFSDSKMLDQSFDYFDT